MPAPNLETLFAYELAIEKACKTILDANGLNGVIEFSDEDPGTPRVEVQLQSGKPNGHQWIFNGVPIWDSWVASLVWRIVTVRGKNSAEQAQILGKIRAIAYDYVPLFSPLLPFHAIEQFKEAQFVRGVDDKIRFDWSELTHNIVFSIRNDAWPVASAPALVPPPAPAPPPPDEFTPTIGVWGSYGQGPDLPDEIIDNKGIVGLQIDDDWDLLNPNEGEYDFSRLDVMVANAAAAGFKVTIATTASHYHTPQWVIDASDTADVIYMLDPTAAHSTFCNSMATCLPWSDPFRQARLDLQAAVGAHFADNPVVEGYMIQFANHHSQDWNVQDLVGPITCPGPFCSAIIPGINCISKVSNLDGTCTAEVDQAQQWVDAGWSEELFVACGKEIIDAAALAWPNQRLELPIGGISDSRMAANYSSPAKALIDYVFGDPDTAGLGKSFASRFYPTRQIFLASWKDGTFYLANPPGQNSQNYIRWMIAYRARAAGPFPGRASVQNQWGASAGPPDCLLQGGSDGICGPTCPPACVIQACFDKILTYNLDRIEIIFGDTMNTDFYEIISDATIAMGGTPRP